MTAASSTDLRRVRVARVHPVAERVRALTLVPTDGAQLPRWEPGAHVDVVLPSGLVRPYSLCGDPEDTGSYRVAVLHEPESRGGSREIHESDLEGTTLQIRGPRNNFELVPAAAYLFIAGGIGITPLLAHARAASRAGTPWRMAYGGRTAASMSFVPELAELGGGSMEVFSQDTDGLLPIADLIVSAGPSTRIYCCGPEALIRAVEEECARVGRHEDLHVERFVAPAEHTEFATVGFEVELRRTGPVLWVPPGRSVLDVVQSVLPNAQYSCREGTCGACEVDVLDGVPEHRDTVLTPAERERGATMMICVGRSRSPRLVLDL